MNLCVHMPPTSRFLSRKQRLYVINEDMTAELKDEYELEKGEDAPMSMAGDILVLVTFSFLSRINQFPYPFRLKLLYVASIVRLRNSKRAKTKIVVSLVLKITSMTTRQTLTSPILIIIFRINFLRTQKTITNVDTEDYQVFIGVSWFLRSLPTNPT